MHFKFQGVTKGLVAEEVLSKMTQMGKPADFILCIGDDRSDEDMFGAISKLYNTISVSEAPDIFACTVGQKPSKAKYYLDDTVDVMALLQGMATTTTKPRNMTQSRISFDTSI